MTCRLSGTLVVSEGILASLAGRAYEGNSTRWRGARAVEANGLAEERADYCNLVRIYMEMNGLTVSYAVRGWLTRERERIGVWGLGFEALGLCAPGPSLWSCGDIHAC